MKPSTDAAVPNSEAKNDFDSGIIVAVVVSCVGGLGLLALISFLVFRFAYRGKNPCRCFKRYIHTILSGRNISI